MTIKEFLQREPSPPENYSREEILNLKYVLTVGELKAFIEKHNLPDDAKVVTQRVTDFYFEKGNWKVYRKPDHLFNSMLYHNKKVESGEYNDIEKYPNMTPESNIAYSDEDLEASMNQYHPANQAVFYDDDPNILFLDLHY